jgi:hypothetical protein
MDYSKFSLDELVRMHREAENKLKDALRQGSDWDELEDQKTTIIKLAIEIQKRKSFSGLAGPGTISLL